MSARKIGYKRPFIDAPADQRCKYTIRWAKDETAQCGRRKVEGNYCKQHAAMVVKQHGRDYA